MLFLICRSIGCHFTRSIYTLIAGTFSSVFLARLRHYPDLPQMFALKHIIPTSHPSRIEGELRCLQEIGYALHFIGLQQTG